MQKKHKIRKTNSWKHIRKDRRQYVFEGKALSKWTEIDEDGYTSLNARWEAVNRDKRLTLFMLEENYDYEDDLVCT